jgi:hypothetical protein
LRAEEEERKGERMYIDDALTNEERKTQKKLGGMAREDRDRRKKGENKIQEHTDKRGMV